MEITLPDLDSDSGKRGKVKGIVNMRKTHVTLRPNPMVPGASNRLFPLVSGGISSPKARLFRVRKAGMVEQDRGWAS